MSLKSRPRVPNVDNHMNTTVKEKYYDITHFSVIYIHIEENYFEL